MVLASLPITSIILWAARPVGAASSTLRRMASSSLTRTLVAVVFQPGTPVRIENFSQAIPVTAAACSSLRKMPSDPRFYKHHFNLRPDVSPKTYNSFVAAQEAERVGICHWAMRRRTFVGALRAGNGGLELSTLKSADEVYSTEELWFRQVAVTERELRIGTELIEKLDAPFRSAVQK